MMSSSSQSHTSSAPFSQRSSGQSRAEIWQYPHQSSHKTKNIKKWTHEVSAALQIYTPQYTDEMEEGDRQEDLFLLDLIKKNYRENELPEVISWSHISRQFPGRGAKQCRERYTNVLHPGNDKAAWGSDELEAVFRLHNQKGNRWREIADAIPGRSETAVKNIYYSSMRKLDRLSKAQGRKVPISYLIEEKRKFEAEHNRPARVYTKLNCKENRREKTQRKRNKIDEAKWNPPVSDTTTNQEGQSSDSDYYTADKLPQNSEVPNYGISINGTNQPENERENINPRKRQRDCPRADLLQYDAPPPPDFDYVQPGKGLRVDTSVGAHNPFSNSGGSTSRVFPLSSPLRPPEDHSFASPCDGTTTENSHPWSSVQVPQQLPDGSLLTEQRTTNSNSPGVLSDVPAQGMPTFESTRRLERTNDTVPMAYTGYEPNYGYPLFSMGASTSISQRLSDPSSSSSADTLLEGQTVSS